MSSESTRILPTRILSTEGLSTRTLSTQAFMSRSFRGEQLREIAFPLGGIGTGTVSLGGRGQLRDWEIFNHPGKGCDLPYTFFAIHAGAPGEAGVARVLERRILPPFSGSSGLPTGRVSGLPRLKEATFRANTPSPGSISRTTSCR